MSRSKKFGRMQLGVLCLAISACGGDGGDDNSVNDSTLISGNVEIITRDDFSASPQIDEENSGVAADRQSDCRRPDVLRVGLQIPNASLVLFPESVPLPEQSGVRRTIQVPEANPLFFDSVVVTEIGTVSVRHFGGGPTDSVMELFELDLDNNIVSIAGFGEFDESNGRGRVDIALLPGVYCFYIADAAGGFLSGANLIVDYEITLP